MIRKTAIKLFMIILIISMTLTACATTPTVNGTKYTMLEPSNTWVVLMEKNEFPQGFSDLPINYVNSEQMKDMFLKLGVEEEHILLKKDDMSTEDVEDSIKWLDENSKDNDVVFFYIAAHGSWLREKVKWNKLIAPKWKALSGKKKILVVDSCSAGEFTKTFKNDEESGISIAAAAEDEIGWWGVEDEGLPIIGSIWVKYFTEAVFNEEADSNNDGLISIDEAFEFTTPQLQKYMKEQVFAIDEFLDSWHRIGQYPEKSDGYPNPVLYNHLSEALVLNKLK